MARNSELGRQYQGLERAEAAFRRSAVRRRDEEFEDAEDEDASDVLSSSRRISSQIFGGINGPLNTTVRDYWIAQKNFKPRLAAPCMPSWLL